MKITTILEMPEHQGEDPDKSVHDLGWAFFKHIGGQSAKQEFLKMAKQHGLTSRDQVKQAADFLAYNLTGDVQ